MSLDLLLKDLNENILPGLRAIKYDMPTVFSMETGKISRRTIHPLVYIGLSLTVSHMEGDPQDREKAYIVSQAHANIALNMAKESKPVNVFSYSQLERAANKIEMMRSFFEQNSFKVTYKETTIDAFCPTTYNGETWVGMNMDLMDILRKDFDADLAISGALDLEKLPQLCSLLNIPNVCIDQTSDVDSIHRGIGFLLKEYFTELRTFDSFQTESVDRDWRNRISEAKNYLNDFLWGRNQYYPIDDVDMLLKCDPKNKGYLTRQEATRIAVDEYPEYVIGFDVKKLDKYNRKHMEYVAIKITEISRTSPSEKKDELIDAQLVTLLRPIDELLHNANKVIREETEKFVSAHGYKKGFIGYTGGDETNIIMPRLYYFDENIETSFGHGYASLAGALVLIKNIRERLADPTYSLFGQQIEHRVAISDFLPSHKLHSHTGQQFAGPEIVDGLIRLNEALNASKEFGDVCPVYVLRNNPNDSARFSERRVDDINEIFGFSDAELATASKGGVLNYRNKGNLGVKAMISVNRYTPDGLNGDTEKDLVQMYQYERMYNNLKSQMEKSPIVDENNRSLAIPTSDISTLTQAVLHFPETCPDPASQIQNGTWTIKVNIAGTGSLIIHNGVNSTEEYLGVKTINSMGDSGYLVANCLISRMHKELSHIEVPGFNTRLIQSKSGKYTLTAKEAPGQYLNSVNG